VNTEERQLADVLHRITPEPPRRVTVEQVAYRLVSETSGPQPRRGPRAAREPRPRRGGLGLSRAWAPVLAAAAVVVIAGASAGVAVLASSHHNPPAAAGGAPASSSVLSGSASPSQTQSPGQQATPGSPIAGAPWDAELIGHQTFVEGSLVSADGSLYAVATTGTLDRIDPATGAIVATVPYSSASFNSPVVVGNTVWVVSSYSGGNVILHGYDASTLAQTSSLLVPAIGAVSIAGQGVLTSGPDGNLYVAAGITVAVVNPASGQVTNRIQVTAGQASSLAVSPDGSRLYVGISSSASFKLLVYDLPSDRVVGSSTLGGGGAGGDLVATSGGAWGVSGSGHSEWTWFAPGGDLTRAVRVGLGAGGGWVSYPSYSGGAVWIGGSGNLVCASPATGKVLAQAAIPAGRNGVAQYFASPVVSGGRTYSAFQTDASQLGGLVRMTPPAACSGNVSS
jgi:PQQ-like domain